MKSRSDVLRTFAETLDELAVDIRTMSYCDPEDVDEADQKFRGVLDEVVRAQAEYMGAGQ